ncbi:MAG: hypothetical protein VX733_15240 [Candidatus Latescibacterota bacterium]|nr:hypothetical protein [Candidatus Latescibacterota bacterium]
MRDPLVHRRRMEEGIPRRRYRRLSMESPLPARPGLANLCGDPDGYRQIAPIGQFRKRAGPLGLSM